MQGNWLVQKYLNITQNYEQHITHRILGTESRNESVTVTFGELRI